MMSNRGIVTLVLLGFAGLLFPSTVRAQNGDWVNIQSVRGGTHPLSTAITIGQPFTFGVHLQCSLASLDVANLTVFVEEYPKGSGCGGPESQTNGGNTARISRGSHWLDVGVTWHGDNPYYNGGFLRIGVTVLDPKTQMVVRGFPIFGDYCYPFSP